MGTETILGIIASETSCIILTHQTLRNPVPLVQKFGAMNKRCQMKWHYLVPDTFSSPLLVAQKPAFLPNNFTQDLFLCPQIFDLILRTVHERGVS